MFSSEETVDNKNPKLRLTDYGDVVRDHHLIYQVLKNRGVPPSFPVGKDVKYNIKSKSAEQINLFAAWIYDGLQKGKKVGSPSGIKAEVAEAKRDVTYDDIQGWLKGSKYTDFSGTKYDHYIIYKELRENGKLEGQEDKWNKNDIDTFAAWIVDGLKKSSANEGDFPGVKYVTYRGDIRPLLTECDKWNMEQQTQLNPVVDLHIYESVNYHSDNIYYQLKRRVMPYGAPWEDDQINSYAAWIYDGLRKDENVPNPDSIIVPFYPEGVKLDGNLFPVDFTAINFDDHVKPIFTPGHQKKMVTVSGGKGPNLHDYESVKTNKKEILNRLLGPKYSGTTGRQMPWNNPWPRKNIALFYAWATYEGPKKDRTSTVSKLDAEFQENYFAKVLAYPITPEYNGY